MDEQTGQQGTEIMPLEGVKGSGNRHEAELKAQIVLAREFPVDRREKYGEVRQITERLARTEEACYVFPRGKAQVVGIAAPLARKMAVAMCNFRCGLRIIGMDHKNVHIAGWAMDMQSGNYFEYEEMFAKTTWSKKLKTEIPVKDERELRMLINRRGAIAVRNAILTLLPDDLCEKTLALAKDIQMNQGKETHQNNPKTSVSDLVYAFEKLGVSRADLEDYVGHNLDDMTGEEFAKFRMIWNAISKEEMQPSDYFKRHKDTQEKIAQDADAKLGEAAERARMEAARKVESDALDDPMPDAAEKSRKEAAKVEPEAPIRETMDFENQDGWVDADPPPQTEKQHEEEVAEAIGPPSEWEETGGKRIKVKNESLEAAKTPAEKPASMEFHQIVKGFANQHNCLMEEAAERLNKWSENVWGVGGDELSEDRLEVMANKVKLNKIKL